MLSVCFSMLIDEFKADLDWILALVKANNAASEEDRIPQSELVAQISYVPSHSIRRLYGHDDVVTSLVLS